MRVSIDDQIVSENVMDLGSYTQGHGQINHPPDTMFNLSIMLFQMSQQFSKSLKDHKTSIIFSELPVIVLNDSSKRQGFWRR